MSNATAKIKSLVHTKDLAEEYGIELEHVGDKWRGLCPFHEEKTASFWINDDGAWHCFGCERGGDLFSFAMEFNGWDFYQSLGYLSKRAGVDINQGRGADRERIKSLKAAMKDAASYYHSILFGMPAGEQGRALLSKRGIHKNISKKFNLGYAPDDWDALYTILSPKYEDNILIDAGLVIRKDDGRTYDRFRGRLIIPIANIRGETIAFGARAMGDVQPKYLNSPATPLFNKSATLFAISQAARAIRTSRVAKVVEGYFDVMAAHQAGDRNVVGIMGTAIGEEHIQILSDMAETMIFAMDGDSAGQEAARRLISSHHARAVDTRIAVLPSGKDPDDVIREDFEMWRELMHAAKPAIDFYMSSLLDGQRKPLSPRQAQSIYDNILPLLQGTQGIEREKYIQRIGDALGVGYDVVRKEMQSSYSKYHNSFSALSTEEAIVLSAALHTISRINAVLSQVGLEDVCPTDFATYAGYIYDQVTTTGIDIEGLSYAPIAECGKRIQAHLEAGHGPSPETAVALLVNLRVERATDRLAELNMKIFDNPAIEPEIKNTREKIVALKNASKSIALNL